MTTPTDDFRARIIALRCPATIIDHGQRQAWERGRRDALDALRPAEPVVSERAGLLAQINSARDSLEKAFVAEKERWYKRPLKDSVKAAIAHHEWHHDAQDVSYVKTIEKERDQARTALEQIARDGCTRGGCCNACGAAEDEDCKQNCCKLVARTALDKLQPTVVREGK